MNRALLFCFLFFSLAAFAQEKPEWRRDTVIGTNRFSIYNNWLCLGGGIAINTNKSSEQVVGTLDYNIHIQKEYFKLGVMLSGDAFGSYTTKQMHLCYGRRKENMKMNLSYFGGLSFSEIYSSSSNSYNGSPGFYAEVEYIRKLTYDVGLGPAIFADVNTKQSIIGIKIDVYFSGAFKGSTVRGGRK